nr:MAG TPA: hypothetical protein [Caudoviricetes sp.]
MLNFPHSVLSDCLSLCVCLTVAWGARSERVFTL